ncbi:hypothetical protein NQZ68_008835 [Dissostichus eleginoides]|nr:hypothetical protein NQZ68_008835 [Dissostichus eleginoides]
MQQDSCSGINCSNISGISQKQNGSISTWVTLVELPALSGKPQEARKKESLESISLCDPEGVHCFVLVLPLEPPSATTSGIPLSQNEEISVCV